MDFPPDGMRDVMGKHDPLGDAITVALVLVTLFGALVAWRQANAHFEHDEATVRAEEWTVLASSQRTRAHQAEQIQLGRRRLARHNRMKAREAIGRLVFEDGNPDLLALEAEQWRERARRTALVSRRLHRQGDAELREIEAEWADAFPDIDPDLGLAAPCAAGTRRQGAEAVGLSTSRGPPPPSYGYATDLRREAFRMEGRRAAAAATAVRAEEQFTRYAAALALIAVALFFLGYALTKYGHRFRKFFAFVAIALTSISAYLAVTATVDSPPKPDPAAAAAYADGQIALERGHFQKALVDFACATHRNPDFAEAFLGQGRAFDLRGMPRDVAVINESLENRDNLRQALRYAQRARELDPEDPRALNQIATALFVYGVSEDDRGKLSQALALHRRQAEAMPRDPVPAFNAGTTRLALGMPWKESYREAEQLMGETSQPLGYVGGALTDLDFLRSSHMRQGLAAEVREAKEQVVVSAMADVPGEPGSDPPHDRGRATASGMRLQMTPAAAYLEFDARGLRVDRDQVFLAVYRHERLGWQEIQPLSGPVAPARVQGGYLATLWSSSLTSCLIGGRYKVELYVNGRLANAGALSGATTRLPKLVRRSLPGMNLRLCVPGKTWQRIPAQAAGLVDGFEGPGQDGREGIVVFDVSANPPRSAERVASTLIKRFSPPLPEGVEMLGPLPGPPAIGNLSEPRLTSYAYPNGEMIMATATTPIGRRLAIAAFGPPALFAWHHSIRPIGQSLLESLVTYD